MLPLVLGAAALFAAVVALAPRLARPSGKEAPDYAVVPTGLRVRVVAIDGLERRMAEHLAGSGEMPALAAAPGQGRRARLRAEPERVPAIVWTTVATGRGPEAHGIQSADTRRITGLRTPVSLDAERSPFTSALGAATDFLRLTRPQPPSAVLRSVKTFWNVASEKGLRVGVVNWWATWPADAVNGYLVTDRAAFKLEKGGPPDREVYPAEAFEPLRAARSTASEPERARRLDRFHRRRRPRPARRRAARPRGPLPPRPRHLHDAAARRGAGQRPRRPRRQARRRARAVPLRGRAPGRGGGRDGPGRRAGPRGRPGPPRPGRHGAGRGPPRPGRRSGRAG